VSEPRPPGGKPIPGRTNEDDTRFALDCARRYIFRGGDRTNPRYRSYVDLWLDYMNKLKAKRDVS